MTSPFSKAAKKLYVAGYSVIPIGRESKRAFEEGWSKYCEVRASQSQVKAWAKQDGFNIGVTLGPASNIVALDYDVDVNGLHAEIEKLVPDSPVKKVGKRGYTAFYRYNGEINRKWKSDKQVVLELLSAGRQTVMPPSVHPLGGSYSYSTMDELGDVPASALPLLPESFCGDMDRLFGVERSHSKLDATAEDIEGALEHIDADDYDTWIQVGMAIRSAFPDDEGFTLWDEWSQSSDKYRPEDMRQKWGSFKRGGISVGTLFYHAIQNGYDCRFTDQELRQDVMQFFITLDQVEDEIDLWRAEGKDVGVKSGVPGLDKFLHFRRRETTLLGGYSNAGKSEFADSIIVGLMQSDERWKGALCSMEKGTKSHYDNLIQKVTQTPRQKVSVEAHRKAKAFLRNQVIMLDYGAVNRNFDSILSQIERYMKFNTIDFILVDPFNYLNTSLKGRDPLMHLQHIMTGLSDFVKLHNIHGFLVAHPQKPPVSFGESLPKLTQYSFSGGADFANIADNIIAVHRNEDDTVDIDILKVRDQEVDRRGGYTLSYDPEKKAYEAYDFVDEDENEEF